MVLPISIFYYSKVFVVTPLNTYQLKDHLKGYVHNS